MLKFEPHRGFGVYIHWPYCAKICPYCDFNVYAAKQRDVAPLLSAIEKDLTTWREKTGSRQVDTIFFGGGTPSLIPPKEVKYLIDVIASLWGLAPDVEISLEANPDDRSAFVGLANAGINRLSLGVQSLSNDALKFLGRNHDAEEALRAIEEARSAFPSLSLDFIYALPRQNLIEWKQELSGIIDLKADHLSLYELTIEQRTAFGKAVGRGEWQPADDDTAADLYEITQEMMCEAGYPAYEISNHAISSQHHAQHNLVYWNSGDWLGIGPGAHGRVTIDGNRYETVAERRPEKYISVVEDTALGLASQNILTIEDVANERVMMGLRKTSGMPKSDFEVLVGRKFNQETLSEFIDDGLLEETDSNLKLTPAGRLLADYVSSRLVLQ